MGLLRIFLAISVVIAHSGSLFGFTLVGGHIAVQAFYIISGFYITLILNEKYIGKNGSYKLFLSNRLLRLYPIYWTVFLLTIITSLGVFIISSGHSMGKLQPYYDFISSMKIESIFFLVLSNLIMLFQDMVMFLGLDTSSGALFFTSNFRETVPELYTFLIVPQAWTVGVEITFYLIAPFLLRRNILLIFSLILTSALLRIILYKNGLNYDPWTYRFFPSELFFFLLGTIAYHFYKKIENWDIKKSHLKMIYIFILSFTFFYSRIPFENKIFVYFFFFFLSLPFIFILSKEWKVDRYIGELSYPIYISHILVLMFVNFSNMSIKGNISLITIIFSILFSVLLNEFIGKKIERIRQSRIKPITKST